MDELQFIVPDLDTSPIREYIEQHIKHALDVLSDPDIPLTDEISKFELYRLNAAVGHLESLKEIYLTWQRYRQSAHDSIMYILKDMEKKFEDEVESAE